MEIKPKSKPKSKSKSKPKPKEKPKPKLKPKNKPKERNNLAIKLISPKKNKEEPVSRYSENIGSIINKIKNKYQDLDKGIRFCWKNK